MPHEAPRAPVVTIIHSSGSPVLAGLSLMLNCSAVVQKGILGSPALAWSRDGVELVGEASSGSLLLPFIPVATSHGGVYTCSVRLTIPEAGVEVTGENSTDVIVQSMKIANYEVPHVAFPSSFNSIISSSTISHYFWISKKYEFLSRSRPHTYLWHYFG